MTREEEIRQAALAYSFDTDGGHSGDLNAGRDDFINGAKWADEHPATLWHSVADGDLPTENKEYLVFVFGVVDFFHYHVKSNYWSKSRAYFYKDCCTQEEITHWMEIPQIPKKGGNE